LANEAIAGISGPEWEAKVDMLVHQGPSAVRVLFDDMRREADERGYDPGDRNSHLANLYFVCHRAEEILNRWAIENYTLQKKNARTSTEKTRIQAEREMVMPRLIYDVNEYRRQAAAEGTEGLFEGYKLCVLAFRLTCGIDLSLSTGYKPARALDLEKYLRMSPEELELAIDPSWLSRQALPWRGKLSTFSRYNRQPGTRDVREPYTSPNANQLFKR
jgi:hypothetical protein